MLIFHHFSLQIKFHAAFFIFMCLFHLQCVWSADEHIIINEIHYHPSLENGGSEFIELMNSGEEKVDLSGWSFTEGIQFTFPHGTSLEGKACLILVQDASMAYQLNAIPPPLGVYDGRLSNEGERITLMSDLGRVIESFRYSDSSPWPSLPDGHGPSLERISPLFDEDFPSSWRPGSPHSAGFPNTHLPSKDSNVIINEIFYHPRIPDSTYEYIEIFNRGTTSVSLGGSTLRGGIDFTFPADLVIQPSQFMIITNELQTSQPDFFSPLVSLVGEYRGSLSNSSDHIFLIDNNLFIIDQVSYYDGGLWPEGADNGISSLELVNPWLDNSFAESWSSSKTGGSPGQINTVYQEQPEPIVSILGHNPLVPGPSQPVTVTAKAFGVNPFNEVTLFYRTSSCNSDVIDTSPELFYSSFNTASNIPSQNNTNGISFSSARMYDDGIHGDGESLDGIYGAWITSSTEGSISEFYVEAVDTTGKTTKSPREAPVKCCLFQVDSQSYPHHLPLYRVVMKESDLENLHERDPYSNTLLNCTFISQDSAFYSAGIRYRGRSSRLEPIKSYRIDFLKGNAFDNTNELNLNGHRASYQIFAWDFVTRLGGCYPPETGPVQLILNNEYSPLYCRIESIDDDYLKKAFPDDHQGNLYRGDHTADFQYLGEDPNAYCYEDQGLTYGYLKKNNPSDSDIFDVIKLTRIFSQATSSTFPEQISELIDAPQWIRFFALHNLLGNLEGGIYLDTGDDFFLYHRKSDDRFVILPWDLDNTFRDSQMPVFRQSVPAIVRLIHSPEFVRLYYSELLTAMKGSFSIRSMRRAIEQYESLFPTEVISDLLSFCAERTLYLESSIHDRLSYESGVPRLPSSNTTIDIASGDTWLFFRGLHEPSDGNLSWTLRDFDDSSWEAGITGIGFGDGDDSTILSDMEGQYLSVYLRHTFSLENISALTELFLSVDWDDGFIAYLNGIEVVRSCMGNIDSFVSFDQPAMTDHEAGVPTTFDISEYLFLVKQGNNTLAIQCHNRGINSTDLTIIPELSSFQKPSESCGLYAFTSDTVTLRGHANAAFTKGVLINGVEASWNPLKAEWKGEVSLSHGLNKIELKTITNPIDLSEDRLLYFYMYNEGTQINGLLPDSSIWTHEKSPYILNGNVTLPANSNLEILPGTTVLLGPEARFNVSGSLSAIGTPDSPIVFLPFDCTPWDRIELLNAPGNIIFKDCIIEKSAAGGVGSTSYLGAITINDSHAIITNCLFRSCGMCIAALNNSNFEVSHTKFIDSFEGIHSYKCYCRIDSCTFENVIGYSDAIDLNGPISPSPQVINCLFVGGDDDAIDLENTSPIIEGNIITGFDFSDNKGISLEGIGIPILHRNLIYGCDVGIAIKNLCAPLIDHNTVVDNRIGIHSYEKNYGDGPGYGTMKSSILWNNDHDFCLEHGSILNISYSNSSQYVSGKGNISCDPLFTSSKYNDYSLKPGSPSLGTGEQGTDMGAFGFTGPRIAKPTMTPSPLPTKTEVPEDDLADFNFDGIVDISDLYYICRFWHQINPIIHIDIKNPIGTEFSSRDLIHLLHVILKDRAFEQK